MRTVRFFSRVVFEYLLGLLAVLAALLLFLAASTPAQEYESMGGRFVGMTFSFSLMFPALIQISLVPVYLPLTLSMGVTRRGCFLGLQAAKLQLTLGCGAALVLTQLAAHRLFGAGPFLLGETLAGACAGMLISAALGETFGCITLRFGRKGLTVFCIVLGAGGGVVGAVFGYAAMSDNLDGLLAPVLRQFANAPMLVAVALALCLVLTAVDWRICRRITLS